MRIIDADKFLAYLIFSKNIDGLTCGEVKEAIEMSKVDVFDKIKTEIEQMDFDFGDFYDHTSTIREMVLKVIDKYKAESEDKE